MAGKRELIPVGRIAQSIHCVRGQKVMLDADLAALYEVPTGQLNRAVKRNLSRFPSDFMFRLNRNEARILKCQIGISRWGGRRGYPYVFTEQGVAMLSSVLGSPRAVKVNIAIMRAFVRLRETLDSHRELANKFAELRQRVGRHDEEIAAIIDAIRQLMAPPAKPRREIGFHVRETRPRYRTRSRR
jgi:hypothetical protein